MNWIIYVWDELGYMVENADFFTNIKQVRAWTRRAREVWGDEAIIQIRKSA